MPVAKAFSAGQRRRGAVDCEPSAEDYAYLAGRLAGMAGGVCDSLLVDSFEGKSPPAEVLEAFRRGWDGVVLR